MPSPPAGLRTLRRFLADENGGGASSLILIIVCSLSLSWGSAFAVKAMLSGKFNGLTKALGGIRNALH